MTPFKSSEERPDVGVGVGVGVGEGFGVNVGVGLGFGVGATVDFGGDFAKTSTRCEASSSLSWSRFGPNRICDASSKLLPTLKSRRT